MTIELSEYVIDAIADAVVKKMGKPCEDTVSRQAVIDINERHHGQMPNHVNHEIWKEIKALQSVTPQQKVGQWIFDEVLDHHYYCSECKAMGVDYWDYCPYCGSYNGGDAE